MALRACRRCAQQKRRCDHGVPTCQLCKEAGEVCVYPRSTRKHGPTAGMPERYTSRIRELEAALDFLLRIPEVRTSLDSMLRVRGSQHVLSLDRGLVPNSKPRTSPISTLGDLIGYAQGRPADQSSCQGHPRQGDGSSRSAPPVWAPHPLPDNWSDTAGSEEAQTDERHQNISPARGDLENFASIATQPRFDFSFPTTPASFNAMLAHASDQADLPRSTQNEHPPQWSTDAKEAERADELYW